MGDDRRDVLVMGSKWIYVAALIGAVLTNLQVAAAQGQTQPNATPASEPGTKTVTCENQNYALCATARCNVYNEVAYCQCDKMFGTSISSSLTLSNGQDVCSVNAEGANNGYEVSTYSPPESIVAPQGNSAIYNCPGGTAEGAYAQCDGGLCFDSTEGASFPGFDKPVPNGQIICSCPITTASADPLKRGYQIVGPFPCQQSFFQYCRSSSSNSSTGSTIYVGAPTGIAELLTIKLDGSSPAFNECNMPPLS